MNESLDLLEKNSTGGSRTLKCKLESSELKRLRLSVREMRLRIMRQKIEDRIRIEREEKRAEEEKH